VLAALRRFDVEARANVHEGLHARTRAATDAYDEARACFWGPPLNKLATWV
jgi:selenocysteine lyase/cysteine desulfurase